MANLLFVRSRKQITFTGDDGSVISFECRPDFFPTSGGGRYQHEELPDGNYTVSADVPGNSAANANGPAYGTFYIETGDYRERDIHGGGSDLPDPFAPRQGWEPTYGCLRMQNEDGEELSKLILSAGNSVPLTVLS